MYIFVKQKQLFSLFYPPKKLPRSQQQFSDRIWVPFIPAAGQTSFPKTEWLVETTVGAVATSEWLVGNLETPQQLVGNLETPQRLVGQVDR